MIRKTLLAALGVLFVLPASADESGLAAMHDWKQEKRGTVCMATHFHDGSGEGTTRKEAEKAAALSWREFTSFEYGSDWDSYNRSAGKTMDCFEMAGTKKWSCSTSSRPCKQYVKSGGNSKSARR
jgi:hypothetical protein